VEGNVDFCNFTQGYNRLFICGMEVQDKIIGGVILFIGMILDHSTVVRPMIVNVFGNLNLRLVSIRMIIRFAS